VSTWQVPKQIFHRGPIPVNDRGKHQPARALATVLNTPPQVIIVNDWVLDKAVIMDLLKAYAKSSGEPKSIEADHRIFE
jgi:hypothetical protein